MSEEMNLKRFAALLLALALCLTVAGCRNSNDETTPSESNTEPTGTVPAETVPDETEPAFVPEDDEPVILEAGTMQKHMKGKNGDLGIYFMMEPNDVPADTSWATEFRPTSKDAIQLIRGGETYDIGKTAAGMIIKYSDTEYYLKLEEFLIREYFPIRDGDILKIEGIFRNAAIDVRFQIDTSYIQISEGLVFFSTDYPTGTGVSVKNVGNPKSHPNGKTSEGIYFTLDKNSVPYDKDWKVEYSPTDSSAIQLIRNGKTYSIGNKEAGTIVKYSDTEYYLKLEKWIIKDFYPIRDGDVIVLNGKFVNSGVSTVFSISKTYISINEGLLTFSTEYPTESNVEAQVIPTMLEHPNGFTGTGVYFKAAEANTLPFDGWSVEYFPREAGCIKLIRDGETYDIANIDAGTIVKYSDTEYYFKLEQWIYKDKFPFTDGDILIVEGKFVNAGLAGLMEIGKTYIAINGGMAYFSAEYPDGPVGPTKIQGGTMSSHPDGWKSDANGGLFFKMDVNDAPFATDWSLRYVPTTADAVKLIRNGVTTNVGNTGAEMIAKYREDSYYLEFWPISLKPIVEGDTLVIEGNFVNAANNVVLVINKTYVTIENGQPVFTTDMDVVMEAGHMQPHSNGWNTNNNEGLYFKLDANEVPYDGWNVEYEPASAASIQLIRGEETYKIGIPGRGTIVKYSDTEYYLKLAAWTIGDYAPIVPGDQLIVEGQFKNAVNGVIFNISRTVITVGEGYSLTFTSEEAVDPTIQAGVMSSHPNGWNTANNKGMYFSLTSNEVPFSDDWSVFYYPTTAENIKLIRDGETLDIAQTDREFIVKYGDTDYYLKLEKWTIGDYFPIVPGDVLVVEGKFSNPVLGVEFSIDTTYIAVGENYVLTFTESAPGEPENPETPQSHGLMKAHGTNGWTATGGLYFTMDANDLPYDSWNIRYTPTSEGNVKLIRNGQTYNVAHTARETIVKYSNTEYYFEFWTLADYKPVVAGDVLIVEGGFYNGANDATLMIEKTVITFHADGTATFASEVTQPEEPEQTEPSENDGTLKPHPEKAFQLSGAENLIYATMTSNSGAHDGWNTEYTPVQAGGLKLIRDGVTYEVGNPGQGTLVKYSDTEYCLKLAPWTVTGDVLPLVAGDVIVVEGAYVGRAGTPCEGSTIVIAKTSITFHADETLSFEPKEEEEPENPGDDEVIQVGMMMANASGITDGIIYFSLADNDLPYGLTKSDFRPVDAGVIKLIRNGVTYDVANPEVKTIVKQTASKYRLLRSALTMELQPGDILVVDGKFIGGNKDEEIVYTISVGKTYIFIGDGTVTFSAELPAED